MTRGERAVTCYDCELRILVSEAGQTLRFRWLCQNCTALGYRLELFTDGIVTPRKWYVHVTYAGRIVK